MFPARKAISYLHNKEEFQQYKCSLCYNLSLDIFQCQGACQKYYCVPCIDKFASNRYACKYCADGLTFKWKAVQLTGIEFICPYTLDKHQKLMSIKQFQEHCFDCKQMKQEDLALKKFIQNYQCSKGHLLVFISEHIARQIFKGRSIFTALTQSQCEACKQTTLCRSYCSACSKESERLILYCTKCRNVPATKIICPIGHKLIQKTFRSQSSLCDFCGYSDRFSKKYAFTDSNCNFDICFRCYSKLPSWHKLQHLKNDFEPLKKQEPNKQVNPRDVTSSDEEFEYEFS